MVTLSRVTVVDKPTTQPITPEPMNGVTLDTYASPSMGEYIDPPRTDNNRSMVFAMVVNPRKWLPQRNSDEFNPPEVIFRTAHFHHNNESDPINEIRIPEPCSYSIKANNLVLKGELKTKDLSITEAEEVPLISDKIKLINSNNARLNNLMSLEDNNYENNNDYWYEARDKLVEIENIEIIKTPEYSIEDRILHSWVMCGLGYILVDTGAIFKSNDGFINNIVYVGSTAEQHIYRNSPGMVSYNPDDYSVPAH